MSGLEASPLGLLIGLAIGAVGGGGSLIAVPVLVYLVDQDTREAQATALVIVAVAALAGLVSYWRRDDVRRRAGLLFGVLAGAAAIVGSLVNRRLDPDLVLFAFSVLMALGAAAMVSERSRRPATFRPWRHGIDRREAARVSGLGLLTGLAIGFFGVGGGFMVVPVLVLVLRMDITEAVGTSLLIVVIGSAFALAERVSAGDVDLAVAIPFSVAALLGSLLGRRLAHGADPMTLRRAFAGIVVLVAAYTAARSAGGL